MMGKQLLGEGEAIDELVLVLDDSEESDFLRRISTKSGIEKL